MGQEGQIPEGQPQGSNDPNVGGTANSILDAGGEGAAGQAGQAQSNGSILDAGGNPNGEGNVSSDQQVAPEKYEPFKLGEDLTMETKQFEGFSTVAKELNLTQEQAQKLVDYQSSIVKENHESKTKDSEDVIESWKQETITMLGDSRQAKVGIANKMLSKRPELNEVLTQTGLINHPEVFKLILEYGRMTSEDILVDGLNAGANTVPREKKMYPSMNEK